MGKERVTTRNIRIILIVIGNIIALLIVIGATKAQETTGYIYGTVTTYNSSYTGQLRWGKEESYWNDLFNADKVGDEYYTSILTEKGDKKEDNFWDDVDFWDFSSIWENRKYPHYEFSTPFGNIASLQPKGKSRVKLTLKNGQEIDLNGTGYNDVGTKITIYDNELGDVKLSWDKIKKVDFSETPRNFEPSGGGPIYGTIETLRGSYTGYVQWDHEERLGDDKLDGVSRDGDVSIAFKYIKSIVGRSNSCFVTLHSGRTLTLSGERDVNDNNRGIIVTIPQVGKIEIPWRIFDNANFDKTKNTRDDYRSYAPPKGLRGTVETFQGDTYDGRIVYNADVAWEVETLEAKENDVEYVIPFANIESISPKNSYYSIVKLRNGDKVLLGDSKEVNTNNDGIILFPNDSKDPIYIKWKNVVAVRFR